MTDSFTDPFRSAIYEFPQKAQRTGYSFCTIIVFLCFAIAIAIFFRPDMFRRCSPGERPVFGANYGAQAPTVLSDAASMLSGQPPVPERPFNQPNAVDLPHRADNSIHALEKNENKRPPSDNLHSTPDETREQPAAAPQARSDVALAGSAPLDASTYDMSDDSKQYYEHFKPASLEQSMPLSWRSGTDGEATHEAAAGDGAKYAEFSRYAISPRQMKRSESLKSALRYGELSRDGLSRTLGLKSLLRDQITPTGPSPLGNAAMLWNDSSVRQNYIATVTGRFPNVQENC